MLGESCLLRSYSESPRDWHAPWQRKTPWHWSLSFAEESCWSIMKVALSRLGIAFLSKESCGS